MMTWKSVTAAVLAITATAAASGTPATRALSELLGEEAKLSTAAATLDPPTGMASMLAEDARVHARGGPYISRAAALDAYRATPANRGKYASWRSIQSGISGDGTHGFTLGYLTIAGGDPKTAQRRYLAYWVKGAAGWRVAAFKQALKGSDEIELAALPQSIPADAECVARCPAPDPVKAKQSLIDAEKAFSDRAQAIGLGAAFAEFGRSDAINNGPDGIKVGAAAIGAAVGGGETGPLPVNWSADEALVAPSGDLGITFGLIRTNGLPPGQSAGVPFFTIWMREGPEQPWRYVAE